MDSNSVNFMNLNGRAARKHDSSAAMINEMAKTVKAAQAANGVPIKTPPNNMDHAPQIPADHVHGLASHPGVPMKYLIQNRFGNDAEAETTQRYEQYFEQRKEQGYSHTVVRETRASIGRAESLRSLREVPVKAPFKLSKFKRVCSKIRGKWLPVQTKTPAR